MDYQRIYDALINRAKARVLTECVEKHHIVPKCIGGGNKADNIVTLTYREHTLAHWLLVRIHPGNPKLAYAFDKMVKGGVKSKHPKLTHGMVNEAKGLASHAKRNTCWITKDGRDKKITKDLITDYLNQGYVKGRSSSNTQGKIRIHKDGDEKFVSKSDVKDYVGEGWFIGGANKKSKCMSKDGKVVYVPEDLVEHYLSSGFVFGNSTLKSRKCITKDGITKRVAECDLKEWLDSGWTLGYIYTINKDKRFISKNEKILRVDVDSVEGYLKQGYKLGYERKKKLPHNKG